MALTEYKRKRDFKKTPEPAGNKTAPRKQELQFVVQKHRASRLHYDFRLEWRGVMLSWAVPKGPALDPSVKRMAMPTEDHPIEYNAFEGVIPEGQYGGGTVMIWDSGTWEPEVDDVDAALKKGDLKFTLKGRKLKGSWVLVRMRPREGETRSGWLLIKHRDAHASKDDVAVTAPRSVVSKRILAEIARDEGGDIEKAATGDPPAEIRKEVRLAKPSVRPSSRPGLSNPDKIFWPEEGYTKGDLYDFYDFVFRKLAPYVKDRLLALKRCPNGLAGKCFFQKEKPESMPADTPTKRIVHGNGVKNYVVGGRKETQLALVNLGCIAIHAWCARANDPRKPDIVCFDLDPASEKIEDAIHAAGLLRGALEALHLTSFVKTSGGKGLHIFIPIRTGPDADDTRAFAETLGRKLSETYPEELTMESLIVKRRNRVYLDPFRNGFAQTVVTPYCVRRKPHAPVSTPLEWSEVKIGLRAENFNIGNFAARLKKKDPWADFWNARQDLKPALAAVNKL
jgi:bifunctional non-homologous end joining protein LigD